MTSLDASLPRPARLGARRRADADWLRPAVTFVVVAAMLLLIGRGVAMALDSPLLAIVADGMLFLAAVAVRGAIDQGQR